MIFEEKIKNIYRGMMFTRYDDRGLAYYYSAADFPGLGAEEYIFPSSEGHILAGMLYSYPSPIAGRLVIFEHGIGGGHRSYMREIELLCRHGYSVLAYDHTGCWRSGGSDTGGLCHSLCDLNDCIEAVAHDRRFAGCDISVMGHSHGGFSALNIYAWQPRVSHIVALCGFLSVELMAKTTFPGLLCGYRRPIIELERQRNPKYSAANAAATLADADTKILAIYSDNDRMCPRLHYDTLRAAIGDRPGARVELVSGRGHNPNYTPDAVAYLGEYSAELARLQKKRGNDMSDAERAEFRSRFDWARMTEQDSGVWEMIFSALDS